MTRSADRLSRDFVLRSKELEKILGSRIAIKRQTEEGKLQALGSGIYASPSLDPIVASALAVTKYYPKAVISDRTALFLHGLNDAAVSRIDVDIPSSTSLRNRLLEVHRVVPSRLVGIGTVKMAGHSVRAYDLERTLCEAYRIDPAGPEFFQALKRYLKKTSPKTGKIKNYDEALGTKVLMHLMQEMADG